MAAFKNGDVVRFTRDYTNMVLSSSVGRCPKGTWGIISSSDIRVTLLNGAVVYCPPDVLEHVPGLWRPLTWQAAAALRPGKDLVRCTRNLQGIGETFTDGGVHVVKRVQQGHVYLRDNDSKGASAFHYSNFEVFVPTPEPAPAPAATPSGDPKKAMTFNAAASWVAKLNAFPGAEGTYRLRQRSWDKKGLYAAIDRHTSPGGAVSEKLYTEEQCQLEMRRLEATQVPIDVPNEGSFDRHIFYTPEGKHIRNELPGRVDSTYFTDAQVQQCGGVVTFEGRKYRMCKRVIKLEPLLGA